MDARRAAALIRPFGLLAAILLATLAGAGPSALANDTPGNNATVKIHDGATENDAGAVRNEPHVCTFHLHFFFADPEQAGTWEIQAWAPTGDKGTVVKSGTYDTAGDGEDRQPATGVYTLPDGHYKLFWDGDLDTGKHDKMKVFWVDCAPASEAPSAWVTPSESAVVPSGSELPIEGSAEPTGDELDIIGTPPPTDSADLARTSGDAGWRAVLLGLAAAISVAAFAVPALISDANRATGRRRR
jgi:hypothetical protein